MNCNEDQIPPDIFQQLKYGSTPHKKSTLIADISSSNDQAAAMNYIHQTMDDPFYNKEGDAPTSWDNPLPAWWAAQRGGPTAAQSYLAGQSLDPVVSDYMWDTVGIRNWITQGGHETDDWIESSCLGGRSSRNPWKEG
ncbi:MAG: hypothetical protein HETSPECPRED_010315 [Heterodermia speciosa]|uniref:Uncharacterized protein n=1 Tax=Heterodermia speciosa TaxID=116794 RepID=A0A8H3G1P3_9LECA|nr:MAG: hypothetical protein HETSPECPRED_010315 [Heterodermia speciosa]